MEDKKLKAIPDFSSEDEEREFWASHDTTDYVDWSKAVRVTDPNAFPNLKPSEDLVELKLPMDDVKQLDSLAKKQHITRDALASNVISEWIRKQQDRARA